MDVRYKKGILMWITALSIELWICGASVDVSSPGVAPGKAALARRRLNFAASACICSLALWMLAFYNWYGSSELTPLFSNISIELRAHPPLFFLTCARAWTWTRASTRAFSHILYLPNPPLSLSLSLSQGTCLFTRTTRTWWRGSPSSAGCGIFGGLARPATLQSLPSSRSPRPSTSPSPQCFWSSPALGMALFKYTRTAAALIKFNKKIRSIGGN